MSTLQSVLPLVVDRPLPVPSGVEECSRFSMFNKKGKFYVSMPCGKWDCPVCNPKVARGVRIRMEQSEANKWTVISHIVLTVHGKYESGIINQAFNDLMTFIRRGGDFPFTDYNGNSRVISLPARPNLKFIRVPEIQMERMENTGDIILHLHIVFNQRLTKYDLLPIWQHALKLHGSKNTFNYVNDTHPKNINAGNYLFKYFTKYECQELFEKGARRYSSSRGVIPSKPVKSSSGEWVLCDVRLPLCFIIGMKRLILPMIIIKIVIMTIFLKYVVRLKTVFYIMGFRMMIFLSLCLMI